MRKTNLLCFGFLLLAATETAKCQSGAQATTPRTQNADAPKIVNLPFGPLHSKPKLSLLEALKSAEEYVRKEKPDLSSYWLYEARFILYGDKKDKVPCWGFSWLNDGISGDRIEVLVFMNGKVFRPPSM